MPVDVEARAEAYVPPLVALAFAIVALSTSAILIRWSEAPSTVKALYRVVFTISLLAPWALRRSTVDELGRLSRRDGLLAIVAGIALAIHFAAWFESLEWTSVAASVTLVQTQPIFVALGAYLLLRERITGRMVAGILVAVVGAAAMTVADASGGFGLGGAQAVGNALALVGALMAAGYVLAGRSIRQRVGVVAYVLVVYTACAVVLFGIVLAQGVPLFDYPAREWLLFLGMAVGPGLLGHTVVNWALAHLESSVVSVSLLGEPVGATILALALLGEVPTETTILGGAIVLAGIYVTAADRSG